MIRALSSEVPNLIKWFALCALKYRSQSNGLRSALWSPEFNQMICALKSRTEPNNLRSALWSPELNQIICALMSRTESNDLRSEVPNLDIWRTDAIGTCQTCDINLWHINGLRLVSHCRAACRIFDSDWHLSLHNIDYVTQERQNDIDLINSMSRSSIRFIDLLHREINLYNKYSSVKIQMCLMPLNVYFVIVSLFTVAYFVQ